MAFLDDSGGVIKRYGSGSIGSGPRGRKIRSSQIISLWAT